MTTIDEYIDSVLSWIPPGQQRERIEMDLRGHFAERVERGQTADEAIRNFGDPRVLAESYLAAVPLHAASFLSRVAAALIDIPSVFVAGFLLFYTAWKLFGSTDGSFIAAIMGGNPVAMVLCFAALVVMSPLYYIVSDSTTGQTVGKALLGLRVVRESGAKVSVGQAFVRQIPLMFSFYVVDALFALFTEKKQRAFELISKTRVVRA
ncbi:MAG TPA: RDD family protein [Gemmatimonadaceae bacterium]|nr:RDD family protein [Gemmatimonadaceae bacterium]